MDHLEHFDAVVEVSAKVNVCRQNLTLSYTEQGLFWPFIEPVKGTAGDQRRELQKSRSEYFSKRGHGDDEMDVGLNPAQIGLEHVHWRDSDVVLNAELLTNLVDWFLVLSSVEIRHITTVKDVVDVFKLLFVDYLRINKQERSSLVLNTCLHQGELDVFPPVAH